MVYDTSNENEKEAKEKPEQVIEVENLGPVARIVINNENDTKLTLIKLGDREKGFIPPKSMFAEFREMFKAAISKAAETKDPITKFMFSHCFVEFETIDIPKGKVMIVGPGEVKIVGPDKVVDVAQQ